MPRKPKTREQKLVRAIFDNGRIKPYRDGDLEGEFRYIAHWIKKKDGICLDEMASILGIEEYDLLDQLTKISVHGVYK